MLVPPSAVAAAATAAAALGLGTGLVYGEGPALDLLAVERLDGGLRLLVEDGRIKQIVSGDVAPPAGAQAIDCGGRVLMRG